MRQFKNGEIVYFKVDQNKFDKYTVISHDEKKDIVKTFKGNRMRSFKSNEILSADEFGKRQREKAKIARLAANYGMQNSIYLGMGIGKNLASERNVWENIFPGTDFPGVSFGGFIPILPNEDIEDIFEKLTGNLSTDKYRDTFLDVAKGLNCISVQGKRVLAVSTFIDEANEYLGRQRNKKVNPKGKAILESKNDPITARMIPGLDSKIPLPEIVGRVLKDNKDICYPETIGIDAEGSLIITAGTKESLGKMVAMVKAAEKALTEETELSCDCLACQARKHIDSVAFNLGRIIADGVAPSDQDTENFRKAIEKLEKEITGVFKVDRDKLVTPRVANIHNTLGRKELKMLRTFAELIGNNFAIVKRDYAILKAAARPLTYIEFCNFAPLGSGVQQELESLLIGSGVPRKYRIDLYFNNGQVTFKLFRKALYNAASKWNNPGIHGPLKPASIADSINLIGSRKDSVGPTITINGVTQSISDNPNFTISDKVVTKTSSKPLEIKVNIDATELDKAVEGIQEKVDKIKSDIIKNPAHYGGRDNVYEVLKVIDAWNLHFTLSNSIKYIARAGKKDNNSVRQELEKAKEYIDRYLEFKGL